MSQQRRIKIVASQGGTIAHHDQFQACPGECHIHASRIGQKTDFPFSIGSYAGNQDSILFASLKTVDGINFQLLSIPLVA